MPGLLYLLGLNAIAAQDPDAVGGIASVVVFNLFWWTVPLLALALSIRRPEQGRAMLSWINDWGRRHERLLVGTLSILVGLYFTARGVAGLV